MWGWLIFDNKINKCVYATCRLVVTREEDGAEHGVCAERRFEYGWTTSVGVDRNEVSIDPAADVGCVPIDGQTEDVLAGSLGGDWSWLPGRPIQWPWFKCLLVRVDPVKNSKNYINKNNTSAFLRDILIYTVEHGIYLYYKNWKLRKYWKFVRIECLIRTVVSKYKTIFQSSHIKSGPRRQSPKIFIEFLARGIQTAPGINRIMCSTHVHV